MNITTTSTTKRSVVAFAALLAGGLALAGCSSTADAETGTTTTETAAQGESLSIVDPWVKSAESGMSAAFGTIENDSNQDATVVSAATEVSPMIELHETVADASGNMVMQEKDGGFVIPAGGSYELTPGGNHIMLMGLSNPVVAGDEVTFTLELADGSTFDFTAAARDYSGANENYVGDDEGGMDMDGMDMGDDEHADMDH